MKWFTALTRGKVQKNIIHRDWIWFRDYISIKKKDSTSQKEKCNVNSSVDETFVNQLLIMINVQDLNNNCYDKKNNFIHYTDALMKTLQWLSNNVSHAIHDMIETKFFFKDVDQIIVDWIHVNFWNLSTIKRSAHIILMNE